MISIRKVCPGKVLGAVLSAAALVTFTAPPAMADDGAKAFKKNRCAQCHKVNGKNGIGPYLNGVVGRTAGGVEKYKYGSALVKAGEAGVVWDEASLDAFLQAPKKWIREKAGDKKAKFKMAYPGLKKEDQRKLVIEYLKAQK